MQCTVCGNLAPATLDSLRGRQRATLWLIVGELRSSAPSCSQCNLLLRALSIYKGSWLDEDDDRSIELGLGNDRPALLYYRPEALYLDIYRDPSAKKPASLPLSIGPGAVIADYSGSESCLSLASRWLSDCLAHHPLCQPAKSSTLPTRALDVGIKQDTAAPVRLVDGIGRHEPYLALSYCWGKPETDRMLTTTKERLDRHRQRIDMASLPQTLRDAVYVTRSLGYRHLWIDALCIVQDDKEDWAREAALMRSVYANAAVTIIASGSPGSASGIFGQQSYSDAHKLSYKDGFVHVRKELARDHVDFDILEGWPWNNEPIASRAWTLQETILSNRSLLFTSFELKWMCNEWRKCECGSLNAQLDAGDIGDLRTLRLKEEVSKLSPPEVYRKWTDVALVYSKRQLSYEKDKLPALSSLAQQFARLLEDCFARTDTYLAGLWKLYLPYGLLWEVDDFRGIEYEERPFMVARRPSVWRAPTWSWASIEGAITQPSYHADMQPSVEIVDCEIEPDGIDTYGEVCSGSLTLKGRVVEGLQVTFRDKGNVEGLSASGLRNYLTNTSRHSSWKQTHILSVQDRTFANFSPDCPADLDKGELETSAILIGNESISDKDVMLVLQKWPSETNDVYKRIGVAMHRGSDSSDTDEFMSIISQASTKTITVV